MNPRIRPSVWCSAMRRPAHPPEGLLPEKMAWWWHWSVPMQAEPTASPNPIALDALALAWLRRSIGDPCGDRCRPAPVAGSDAVSKAALTCAADLPVARTSPGHRHDLGRSLIAQGHLRRSGLAHRLPRRGPLLALLVGVIVRRFDRWFDAGVRS